MLNWLFCGTWFPWPLFSHHLHSFQVYMHNLVAEHSLVRRSSEFEAAIHNRDRSSLRLLCDKKSQESEYVSSKKERILFLFFHSYRTNIMRIFGVY